MRVPGVVRGVGYVTVVLLAVPIVGVLQRAPWSELGNQLSRPALLDALWVSLVVSLVAAGACLVLGLPLALLLSRATHRGVRFLRVLVMLPMVLPPVVAGTALLFALGRRGLLGQWLYDWFGVSLPFSIAGAVVAATFVALPFFVITVESALRQAGQDIEEAGTVLGAGAWANLFFVTLPTIRPAIVAGAALAWSRALGEFGATLTFAGSFPGRTRTLPLETYLALESDPQGAIVISLVLLAVAVVVLVSLRGYWLGEQGKGVDK